MDRSCRSIQLAALLRIRHNLARLLFALLHPAAMLLVVIFAGRGIYRCLDNGEPSLFFAGLLAMLIVLLVGSFAAVLVALSGASYETVSRTTATGCIGFAQTQAAILVLGVPAVFTFFLPQPLWLFLAPAIKATYSLNAAEALAVSYAIARRFYWQLLSWCLPAVLLIIGAAVGLLAALLAGSTPAVAAGGFIFTFAVIFAAAVQLEALEAVETELSEGLLQTAAGFGWACAAAVICQLALAGLLLAGCQAGLTRFSQLAAASWGAFFR